MKQSAFKSKIQEEADSVLYPTYFTSTQYASLAAIILANNQMTLEDCVRTVPGFKSKTLLKDLAQRKINYNKYRISYEQSNFNQDYIDEGFIEQCKGPLEKSFSSFNKKILNTGIQRKFNDSLFSIKNKFLEKLYKQNQQSSKPQYLQKLIGTIFSKLGQQACSPQLIKKILLYGGVQAVYSQPIFEKNHQIRDRFKQILYNCKTFRQMRETSGVDISFLKKNLIKDISKCLIQLQIDQNIAQQICDQLIKNPGSNIVAQNDKLTNSQKNRYYKSAFYTKGSLKTYAQLAEYKNSLQFKAKEEIMGILQLLEQSRITIQILQKILNYDFYDLLKIGSIQHLKKKIFQFINRSCPMYLKIFKIKQQNKEFNLQQLKENININRKFDLASIFLKINLPFEEWQQTQKQLLKKNYQIVDKQTLKFQARELLFKHIFNNLQPSFHSEQKTWDNKHQIQLTLLQQFTNKIQTVNFDILLAIVNQILQSNKHKSETADEHLSKANFNIYQQILKNKQIFDFQKSANISLKEKEYQKIWEIKKNIYKINGQERINVPYFNIHQFATQAVNSKAFTNKTNTFITNISKLSGSFEQNPFAFQKVAGGIFGQSLQQLLQKFQKLANQFVNAYIRAEKQSKFESCLQKYFQGNKVDYVKRIIQTNVMFGQNNTFFDSFQLKDFLIDSIKKEFLKNNKNQVAKLLKECTEVLEKLKKNEGLQIKLETIVKQPSQKNSPMKDKRKPQQEFKTIAIAFYNNYCSENEASLLEKVCGNKYNKDPVMLVKKIIETKAFENQESIFFTEAGLSSYLTKRFKDQLASIKQSALIQLKRCFEIFPYLQ